MCVMGKQTYERSSGTMSGNRPRTFSGGSSHLQASQVTRAMNRAPQIQVAHFSVRTSPSGAARAMTIKEIQRLKADEVKYKIIDLTPATTQTLKELGLLQ